MLVIRQAQMQAFRTAAAQSFEQRMVEHLFRFSPLHCRGIGPARVHEAVRAGLQRAAGYGFTQRGPARFYLELMFLFGSHFDTDPQLPPWARQLLQGGGPADQLQRADRLHARVLDYQHAVLGPGHRHARQAMARLRELAAQPLPLQAEGLAPQIAALLGRIAPERQAQLGAAALLATAERGAETAQAQGLDPLRGALLCSLLQFELGHGCFRDPLYPWLSRPAPTAGDVASRTARLERRALAYLELVMKRLGPAPCADA